MAGPIPHGSQMSSAQKNSIGLRLVHDYLERYRREGTGIHIEAMPAHHLAILSQVPVGQEDASPGAWLFALGNQGIFLGIPGTAHEAALHGFWSDYSYWGEYGEIQL